MTSATTNKCSPEVRACALLMAMEHEAEVRIFKARVVAQQVASESPEALVETIEHILALDAYLLDHFLIEIVEELLPRVALTFCDLRLQLPSQRAVANNIGLSVKSTFSKPGNGIYEEAETLFLH